MNLNLIDFQKYFNNVIYLPQAATILLIIKQVSLLANTVIRSCKNVIIMNM